MMNIKETLDVVLGNILSTTFLLVGIIYLSCSIKLLFINNTKILTSFLLSSKEEKGSIKRFFDRFFYELTPKTKNQKKIYILGFCLFIKFLSFLMFSFYFMNYTIQIRDFFALVGLVLFFVNPIIMFRYIDMES